MILLHVALVRGRLCLWGESAPEPVGRRPARARARARAVRRVKAAASPYDTEASRLSGALGDAVPGLSMAGSAAESLVAWLPSVAGEPLPSSPLLTAAGGARQGPAASDLKPWLVSTVPLSAAQAVLLLCACVERDTLAPGLVVSKDLAFWALVLRFAGALVARQRFLPGMVESDLGWRAQWTPVLDGADAQRRVRLAAAMPGACRALSPRAAAGPPEGTALEALDGALAMLVDQLVRTAAVSTPAAPESVDEAWLRALGTPDGDVVEREPAELARLAAAVREWRRPVAVSTDAPFRLCFRLEEPTGGDNSPTSWSVRYLLQGRRDPSLLIPAEKAWDGRSAERLLGDPAVREHLLGSLGQAAGLCPPVEQSLHAPAPSGYETDARGAHAFLTQSAAALEQAGFGVLLPSWWTGKGTRLRLGVRAQVRSPRLKESGGGVGLEQLVHVDWQVALGDEALTLAELRALARMKEPLVRVRGQWVHMTAEEIRAALDLWRRKASPAPMRDVLRIALGATTAIGPLPIEGIEAAGWVGDALARLEAQTGFQTLPPPAGLRATLRPYQQRGYSWLAFLRRWGLGACLADDMGLGKTVQTLGLLLAERERTAGGARPALVVCPTSVIGNWQREAERFTPGLSVLVHHGVGRGRGEAFRRAARENALVVTSYSLLLRDLEHFGGLEWSTVVLDEAQNIKNPETRQARSARALVAGHRIALTGTPVENNVGDLWSIMEFLNPGLLGTPAEFKRSFFIPIQAAHDAAATARLRRLSGPFILRRLKTDRSVIADLPEKMEMKVYCTLTREQASLYQAVLSDAEKAIARAEGIERKGVVLATLSKLKQVCNHPAQFLADNSPIPGRSGKLARLTEMIEEVMESGERALVFSQFAEMGAIVTAHLQEAFGREVLFLHGGVPRGARERMVERFQSGAEGPSVFVLSLKAGGTGLNLTAATHVFHFDRWWNPAVEAQATDRAFRIGQTRRVQVHKLVCLGTLEEKIDAMIESKRGVAEQVVGTGEGWLTELSTAELRQVLALRPEAVGVWGADAPPSSKSEAPDPLRRRAKV
ncbi:MAG: ATP-dependent helicase [Acidobacteria bacterium]|nr:MAG: ATP-dependent helicase [Acidobacteriota bacterium]